LNSSALRFSVDFQFTTQFTCFTSSKVQILTPEGASEFKRVESFHSFGRFSLKGQSFGGLCKTYVRLVADFSVDETFLPAPSVSASVLFTSKAKKLCTRTSSIVTIPSAPISSGRCQSLYFCTSKASKLTFVLLKQVN